MILDMVARGHDEVLLPKEALLFVCLFGHGSRIYVVKGGVHLSEPLI